MSARAGQKQENVRQFGIVRGGRYASRPMRTFSTSEFRLEREMVDAFAAIHGEDGTVPSKGIYNIRAREHQPWRTLARRFLEARAKNAPKEQLQGVLNVFAVWLDELYDERKPDRAA